MELNHFSHEHPLVLSEERCSPLFPGYACSACRGRIVGLSYCCEECRYVLHKWCADLPRELTHHELHPDHPLLLQFPKHDYAEDKSPMFSFCCVQEEEEEYSVYESCEEPIYDGKSWEDSLEERDEEENSHEDEDEDEEDFLCKSCKDLIEGEFIYRCVQCSFNIHADCASLPKHIMLTDLDSNPVDTKACLTFKHINVEYTWGWNYLCNFCNDYGDGSRFVTVKYPGDEPKENDNSWHIQCAMLPQKVKHKRHQHDLTRHPPIEKDFNYDECYCDACEQDRDPKTWIYYCESCEFATHLGCGIAGLDRPKQRITLTLPIYVDPYPKTKLESKETYRVVDYSNQVVDYIQREEERRKERILEDRKGFNKLKHFDHDHFLILYDEKWNEKVLCHACRKPIFGETYICNDCKFYLHRWCAELPQENHRILHSGDQLILVPQDRLQCAYCKRRSSSLYSYSCEECHFILHTACTVLPQKQIHHESHHHPLIPQYYANLLCYLLRCEACKQSCIGPVLMCDLCGFYLHLVCALYPPTGKAKTHRHSLALTYDFQEDPDALEFICDACEKPRTPFCWLYSCPDAACNFVAHVDCVVPNLIHDFAQLGFEEYYKSRFSI